MTKSHYTTGEIAVLTKAPSWLVRRVIDSLGELIPRAGQYRLVPVEMLPRIQKEVNKRRSAIGREVAHAR